MVVTGSDKIRGSELGPVAMKLILIPAIDVSQLESVPTIWIRSVVKEDGSDCEVGRGVEVVDTVVNDACEFVCFRVFPDGTMLSRATVIKIKRIAMVANRKLVEVIFKGIFTKRA